MKKLNFLNVLLMISLPFWAFSQETGILKGRVSDTLGNRLESAAVTVSSLQKPIGTYTNKNGEYQIQVPSGAELIVEFSYMGLQTKYFTLILAPNETKKMDCVLTSAPLTLPPSIISGTKEENGNTSINIENIDNISSPKGSIEHILPGIMSNDENSSQYSVRGGNFDENLVYINGVEIYRPFLIRSSQQEGLSIINPDMVSNVLFSTGGFEARYGDKMSSVLDISYKKPRHFGGSISGSLLGAALHAEDLVKDKFSYSIGIRRHSNKNLLKTLDQKGDYKTSFTDVQGLFDYSFNPKLTFSFLGIYSNHIYGVVPQTRETTFGNMFETMRLKIYFDGEEKDKFQTLLGAFTSSYLPNEKTQLQIIVSGFNSRENEIYDIQGQYWLSKIENNNPDNEAVKGVGTYLDHGRNNLYINVFSVEHKGFIDAVSGGWNWGVKYQNEYIYNYLNEWKLIDSSGFTIPFSQGIPGEFNPSIPPILQHVIHAKNEITSSRVSGFIQKNWTFETKSKNRYDLLTGIRCQYWDFNNEVLVSPRIIFSYHPYLRKNLTFRLTAGVYSQSPFYREYRDPAGNTSKNIRSQKSYQIAGSTDYQFTAWERPFKFVTEIYYKYITDLIPYTIENLRIQYSGFNNAKGYAAGIDLRINGEFVPGIESWAGITVMKTQEKIDGGKYAYLPRPTDQRFAFKLFFQDYIPSVPKWKMNILLTYGSGIPVTKPGQTNLSIIKRYPPYMRVDWGTSYRIKDEDSKWGKTHIFRRIKNISVSFELFNLFDNQNVISYIWISDYENRQFGVPNYLTRRQINLKLTLDF